MATKNGAAFIAEQLDSILLQLNPNDELIISDDRSTDNTVRIIQSYGDKRIKLIQNEFPKGIPKNFENSLLASKGDFIFLADQDDVWLPSKVNIMLNHLRYYDLVISDCEVVDHQLRTRANSFFSRNNSRSGLIKNIFKNSYMGCCMAFNRKLLKWALPFPNKIPIHDFWIGLIAEDERIFLYTEDTDLTRRIHKHYRTIFFPEATIYHYNQRHSYRSLAILLRHISSAITYFNKWGWFNDTERENINQQILLKFSGE